MSNFNLQKSLEILERTPAVLESLLNGLSDDWLHRNEGGESWSPYAIVGHLIHGEKTDWIPRTRIILKFGESKSFEPFDRFAMLRETNGQSINQLLRTFKSLREASLNALKDMDIRDVDLKKRGVHPEFGLVTLEQLIAAWVVHDLGHIRQIARVMAKQYKEEIGPWAKYLPVVNDPHGAERKAHGDSPS